MSDRDVKQIRVDRVDEKQLFDRMLQGEEAAHILLIQADGGLGKSSLLREFREMSRPYPTVFIDLGPQRTSEDILFDCCIRMGKAGFKDFHNKCREIAGMPGGPAALTLQDEQRNELFKILTEKYNLEELQVLCFKLNIPLDEISGDTLSTKAIALITWTERHDRLKKLLDLVREHYPSWELRSLPAGSGEPELTQSLRVQVRSELAKMDKDKTDPDRRRGPRKRIELTAAFVDDLHRIHRDQQQPFVFLLDTFNEELPAEIKEWVVDYLDQAHHYPWIIVVVAGRQKLPDLPFNEKDICLRHELKSFKPQDTIEFAREMDLLLDSDYLELIHDGTDGVPLTLATVLDNLRKRRANQ